MDDMRRQLDLLLGANRNEDREEVPVLSYEDDRLCKFDLCGLCPYQLFPNTRNDLGPCPYTVCPVPDRWREDFDKVRERKRHSFETHWQDLLFDLQRRCDDEIDRKTRRIRLQRQSEPDELKRLRYDVNQLSSRIDALGQQGLFDEIETLMEELNQKKAQISVIASSLPQSQDQELVCCSICSALLAKDESDQRLADHFAGKGHIGFQRIRELTKKIREKREAQTHVGRKRRADYDRRQQRHRDAERYGPPRQRQRYY